MRPAIATIAILTGTLCGQTAPARLSFEVVSIKPTPPKRQNILRQDYCPDGGRFSAGGVPVSWILQYAYRLREYQVAGAPAWLSDFDSSYDIDANPSASVTDEQCREMVQSMFADRFKLKVHMETKDEPVYLLTVGKNGPKLPKGGGETGGVMLNGSVQGDGNGKRDWADGWTMPTLAGHLSDWAGRPVVDRTGLSGSFGITLNFSRRDGDDRPSIFTAVQEQLGLKLESGRAPIEVLVIDHIEKPSEN